MKRTALLAGAIVALALPAAAVVQAPPPSKAPVAPKAEQLDDRDCAPSDTRSTVGEGAPTDEHQPANSNLSDRLAKSNGVICPPEETDPEIKAPTPPGGPMKVVPPPGSPGGDRSVPPK